MLLSQFPLTFHQIHNGILVSSRSLWLFSSWWGQSLWSFVRYPWEDFYSMAWRCCLLHLKTFLRTLILITQVSCYLFSLLELIWNCIILLLTPKTLKKAIKNLDMSKASRPDCILVVVLKNCEPELLCILDELANKCLKGSCFPDCWNRFHWCSLYLRMLGKGLQLKTITLLVFLLLLVKSLKNL